MPSDSDETIRSLSRRERRRLNKEREAKEKENSKYIEDVIAANPPVAIKDAARVAAAEARPAADIAESDEFPCAEIEDTYYDSDSYYDSGPYYDSDSDSDSDSEREYDPAGKGLQDFIAYEVGSYVKLALKNALVRHCLRGYCHGKDPDLDVNSPRIMFTLHSLSMLWETVFRCPCYDCACGSECIRQCDDWHYARCCDGDCMRYSRRALSVEKYLRHHPFWDEMRQKLSDCLFVDSLHKLVTCLYIDTLSNDHWKDICEMCSQMSVKDDYTIVYGAIRKLFAIFNISVSDVTCRWFLWNIFEKDLDPEKVTDTIHDYLRDIMMSTTRYNKVTTPILQDFQSILDLKPVSNTDDLKSEVSRIASTMIQDLKTSCDELKYKKRVNTFNGKFETLAYDISTMTSDALRIPDKSGTIKAGMIKLLQGQLNRLT